MDRYDLMLQLPEFYRTMPFAELQRVLGEMLRRAGEDVDFTLRQLSPSTASGWGLTMWESAYGIPTDRSKSEADRRARLIAKVGAQGALTVEALETLASSVTGYPAEVEEDPEHYRFLVWIIGSGSMDSFPALTDAVNEVKPAHLAYHLAARYTPGLDIFGGALARQSDVWYAAPLECSGHTSSAVIAGTLVRHSEIVRMADILCPQPVNPVTIGTLVRRSDVMIANMKE